jgi:hypothetical protein
MANPRVSLSAAALIGLALHAGYQNSRFVVSAGWAETSKGIYELQHPQQAREHARAILAGGHQPWRLDSSNVAAECLQAFGIVSPQNLVDLGGLLKVVRPGTAYEFSSQGFVYTIYVDKQLQIPVAVKLVVTKLSAPNA